MSEADRPEPEATGGQPLALLVVIAVLALIPAPVVALLDIGDATTPIGEDLFRLGVCAVAAGPLVAAFVKARRVGRHGGRATAAVWLLLAGLAVLVAGSIAGNR
ncbi:hypothetical protein ACFFX1_09700 [Dactylosporangium sucinum]|uniref:Uncharacterized protein n=1 Tax=Dactylosporangium sucinum TaxID=1424081 RepID=A0A917TJJ2_9ACTN|nr:hypothetical protein [Dactylosporangium sucinum]GGM25539.1 hypothetical protein GCM10007977_028380 [Dactylosporangium sucinum]